MPNTIFLFFSFFFKLNLLLTDVLDTNDHGYISTKPDQLLTFTLLPGVTIRDAVKVS